MRNTGRILATLVLSAVAMLGISGTASATDHPGNGCTTMDMGLLCIDTSGGGKFVGRATGALDINGLMLPSCMNEFRLFGVREGGAKFEQTGVAECGRARTWVDFHPNANFEPGSKLCVAVRDSSSPATLFNRGYACVVITN